MAKQRFSDENRVGAKKQQQQQPKWNIMKTVNITHMLYGIYRRIFSAGY